MYPEFRNRIKAQFVKLYASFPKRCTLYCTTGPPAPAPAPTSAAKPRD